MAIPASMIEHCLRCGSKWVRRVPGKPKRCAKCRSKYWNIPKGTRPIGRPKTSKKGSRQNLGFE
jgi:hypothetical protein